MAVRVQNPLAQNQLKEVEKAQPNVVVQKPLADQPVEEQESDMTKVSRSAKQARLRAAASRKSRIITKKGGKRGSGKRKVGR